MVAHTAAEFGEVLDARIHWDVEDVVLSHYPSMHVLSFLFPEVRPRLAVHAPFYNDRRTGKASDLSSRDYILALVEVVPYHPVDHMHPRVLEVGRSPLVWVAFLGNLWADCSVVEEAQEVIYRLLSHDRPSSKDAAHDMLTEYRISVFRGSRNELEEMLWDRMVFDGRGFEVFEREGNRPQQSAFAVKRVSKAHNLKQSQEQRYVKGNAVAEVLLEEPEVDLQASKISTWSCYYCRFSQLSSRLGALDPRETTSGDRLPQVVPWAVVDHSPSCRATAVEVVALPAGEASLEAAWRDLDLQREAAMKHYEFERDSILVVGGMAVRPRNERTVRRVLIAERIRKRHTQGCPWD